MKVTVKLLSVSEIETIEHKDKKFEKLILVCETFNPYPDKIAFSVWNKLFPEVNKLTIGQAITIHYNLSSREFEGKWYHDVNVWKFENLTSK